jgi:ornithine cyclodeaminase
VLVLTRNDISRILTRGELVDAVRLALIEYSAGRAVIPRRLQLEFGSADREVYVMPGYLAGLDALGAKLLTTLPLPDGATRTSGIVVLFDTATGRPSAILDAAELTEERTAAMTRLACERLVHDDVRTVAIIGSGAQARVHLAHLHEAYPRLEEVRVFSRTPSHVERFVAAGRAIGAPVVGAASAEAAVVGAEIVVAATTSTRPVFADAALAPGAIVCGIGTHTPGAAEIPPETVARAGRIVVDTRAGGLGGSGDIAQPIAAGLAHEDSVIELGELLDGHAAPLFNAQPSVFKSVGTAAADLGVAVTLVQRARAASVGVEVELTA